MQHALSTIENLTDEVMKARRQNSALEMAAIRQCDAYLTQFNRLHDQNNLLVQMIRLHNKDFSVDSIDSPEEAEWLTEVRTRVDAETNEALGVRLGYSE